MVEPVSAEVNEEAAVVSSVASPVLEDALAAVPAEADEGDMVACLVEACVVVEAPVARVAQEAREVETEAPAAGHSLCSRGRGYNAKTPLQAHRHHSRHRADTSNLSNPGKRHRLALEVEHSMDPEEAEKSES